MSGGKAKAPRGVTNPGITCVDRIEYVRDDGVVSLVASTKHQIAVSSDATGHSIRRVGDGAPVTGSNVECDRLS